MIRKFGIWGKRPEMDVSTLVLGGKSKLRVLQSGSNLLAAGPFDSSFAPAPYKSIKSICGGFFFFSHNCQVSCYMNYNAWSKV